MSKSISPDGHRICWDRHVRNVQPFRDVMDTQLYGRPIGLWGCRLGGDLAVADRKDN